MGGGGGITTLLHEFTISNLLPQETSVEEYCMALLCT